MAEELRAIPDVLGHVSNELANHGESLAALQRSCHGEAHAAQCGWIGASAAALSRLLDRWSAAGAAHVGRFGQHSSDMRFAAGRFTEMDQHNAAVLAHPGESSCGERYSAS